MSSPISHVEKLKVKAKLLVKAKKKNGILMPLKDALNAIAKLSGYASWRDLRKERANSDLYWPAGGIFPNHWCKTYEEAKGVLAKNSGFLLPYGKQFFVCPVDYIAGLGIAIDDPDLLLVGNDWVTPRDIDAMNRLNEKIRKNRKI